MELPASSELLGSYQQRHCCQVLEAGASLGDPQDLLMGGTSCEMFIS
jgi:hypothetical protein